MTSAELLPIINAMTTATTIVELYDAIGDTTIAGAIYLAFDSGVRAGRKEIINEYYESRHC